MIYKTTNKNEKIMAYDDFDRKQALMRLIKALIIWMIFAMILALLASCKETEYITIEKVRNDTTQIIKWQKDSVWLHDSIHVKEKGDTVMIEKWHTKYIEKVTHDTTYVATHDTIPQPYPVETIKMVEKDLSWWQLLRLWIGNVGLIALLAVGGYYGWKIWRVYKIF
jgi:hypothetical protein